MMRDTLKQANYELYRQTLKHPELSGMGTTALVAKIMKDGTFVIGNVGDCRALLIKIKAQDVYHLTFDNSAFNNNQLFPSEEYKQIKETYGLPDYKYDDLLHFQKKIAQIKNLSEVEADSELGPIVRGRNALSRCLGRKSEMNIDMYEHKMERGDILILASDGITDNLTDQEIHAIIQKNKWNPGKATEDLVQRAQKISQRGESRSKPDDMTVVIATY